jgi:hypothetical protein
LPEPTRFYFGTNGWTVECWIQPETDGDGTIFSLESISGGQNLQVMLDDFRPKAVIASGVNTQAVAGGVNPEGSIQQLPADEWSHLSVIWAPERNSLEIYLNGVLLIARETLAAPNFASGVGGGVFADEFSELFDGHLLELADGVDAGFVEGGTSDFADAPDSVDGERGEEISDFVGVAGNEGQAVGFVEVAGELGEKLVVGDTDGGGEPGLFEDVAPDLYGDLFAGTVDAVGPGDVEKGFVDGERLDERGVLFKDAEDALGFGLVAGHIDGEKGGVGAALPGLAGGHGGVDAEAAGLVGGGGYDTALIGGRSDNNGRPLELGVVPLFNRRVKGVHVDM